MSKFIIENRANLSDADAIDLISRVIADGRISNNNKQYCYATSFESKRLGKIMVWTDLNKKSDRFVITKYPTKEEIKNRKESYSKGS